MIENGSSEIINSTCPQSLYLLNCIYFIIDIYWKHFWKVTLSYLILKLRLRKSVRFGRLILRVLFTFRCFFFLKVVRCTFLILFLYPCPDCLLAGHKTFLFIYLWKMRGGGGPTGPLTIITFIHYNYIIKPVLIFNIIISLIMLITGYVTIATFVSTIACLIILLK